MAWGARKSEREEAGHKCARPSDGGLWRGYCVGGRGRARERIITVREVEQG